VGDFVWVDGDQDGIQDPGEPRLGGVQVVLYDHLGNTVGSTTTDPSGLYAFSCLAPGDYSIGFQLPRDFVFTRQNQGSDDSRDSDADPVSGRTTTVSLGSGQVDQTWDAGMYMPPGPEPDALAPRRKRPVQPATSVSSASPLEECAPTAVVLVAVNIAWTRAGVRLSWRTSSAGGVLGFNVWRAGAKLNAKLVPARAPAARGAMYRFLDRTAKRDRNYTYRLQTVYLDGRSTFTPFRPR
jgi:SdrD B-like domain